MGVLALSPNYGVIHLVHTAFALVLQVISPQFLVVILDPLSELLHNATDSYKIECYATSARALGYNGATMCTSFSFGSACWNVFQKMQLQDCAPDNTIVFPAVASGLQTYGRLNDVFVIIIILLCSGALVLIGACYYFPQRRSSLLETVALCHFLAALFASGLLITLSLAMNQVEYHDNSNKGQKVIIGASSIAIVILPFIELVLDATPKAWSKIRTD